MNSEAPASRAMSDKRRLEDTAAYHAADDVFWVGMGLLVASSFPKGALLKTAAVMHRFRPRRANVRARSAQCGLYSPGESKLKPVAGSRATALTARPL
jgi:hypothetical protein